jgi:protein gp37
MQLELAAIRTDGGTQLRDVNPQTVKEYAEAMARGDQFPPLIAFFDQTDYWLGDGFHRHAAASSLGLADFAVDARAGTQRDAVLFAVGANRAHGLPRGHADVKLAIERLLHDEEWITWSDSWLAEIVGCHNETVREHRERLEATGGIRKLTELLGKDGKTRPRERRESTEIPKTLTIEQWSALSSKDKKRALNVKPEGQFNRQDNDSIEWAQWSWNPITGCLHDCAYCYARDIAERFAGTDTYPNGFTPTLIPHRLQQPAGTKVPEKASSEIGFKNVFTCSMADLFGKWVPAEWIEAVLQSVTDSPQWNFLFLTKFPKRLSEFTFPPNAWIGTTVDRQSRVENAERSFAKVKASVKWLSVEPMLEPLTFAKLDTFQWIVMGGASPSNRTPEWRVPQPWISELRKQARSAGLKVYEKANLWGRLKEYPEGPKFAWAKSAPESLWKTAE